MNEILLNVEIASRAYSWLVGMSKITFWAGEGHKSIIPLCDTYGAAFNMIVLKIHD